MVINNAQETNIMKGLKDLEKIAALHSGVNGDSIT